MVCHWPFSYKNDPSSILRRHYMYVFSCRHPSVPYQVKVLVNAVFTKNWSECFIFWNLVKTRPSWTCSPWYDFFSKFNYGFNFDFQVHSKCESGSRAWCPINLYFYCKKWCSVPHEMIIDKQRGFVIDAHITLTDDLA